MGCLRRLLLLLGIAKIDVIRNDLRAAAFIAVTVFPIPQLEPSGGHHHAALGEILADELRRGAPGQKQLLAYIKTKPARDGLKAQKTEKARRAYREQHESEFIISESAARYFKAQGISKLPASKALQAEIEQLMREKNTLYNEYREKREKTKELQTIKGNIEQILRGAPSQQKKHEQER